MGRWRSQINTTCWGGRWRKCWPHGQPLSKLNKGPKPLRPSNSVDSLEKPKELNEPTRESHIELEKGFMELKILAAKFLEAFKTWESKTDRGDDVAKQAEGGEEFFLHANRDFRFSSPGKYQYNTRKREWNCRNLRHTTSWTKHVITRASWCWTSQYSIFWFPGRSWNRGIKLGTFSYSKIK